MSLSSRPTPPWAVGRGSGSPSCSRTPERENAISGYWGLREAPTATSTSPRGCRASAQETILSRPSSARAASQRIVDGCNGEEDPRTIARRVLSTFSIHCSIFDRLASDAMKTFFTLHQGFDHLFDNVTF